MCSIASNVEWIWQNISTWYLLNHLLHVCLYVCKTWKSHSSCARPISTYSYSICITRSWYCCCYHCWTQLTVPPSQAYQLHAHFNIRITKPIVVVVVVVVDAVVFNKSVLCFSFLPCFRCVCWMYTHYYIYLLHFFVFFVVAGFFCCFLFSDAYMQIHLVGLFFCAFLVFFLHSIVGSNVICRCPFNLICTKYSLAKSAVLHTWNDVAAVIAIAFASVVVDVVVVVASFSAYY